ncbi:alanine racemase [Aliicoccus persicus]|uniref:Alanine racemase n=1 Tax=Aliicoccus persicus TaxID=930138 RepID=A0A662Z677_9STAP|nr:alanine racemase [Aliicoccus persicus]SEW08910.1 alanine racemase [Aliicoccus persicus]
MSSKYYRSTIMEVDLERIEHNLSEYKRVVPNKQMIAVIKANGYGLGSTVLAEFLSEKGIDFFAVATLDEAIELRMHGIRDKILVLGAIIPKDINKAIQHRIAVTAPSLNWVKQAKAKVKDKYEKEVWIHIKVNNGFNRQGTNDVGELKQMVEEIKNFKYFKYEGLYSHFSSANEDNDKTSVEYERFKGIIQALEHPPYVHIQNTAGALTIDASVCNAMRIGIGLFGYYPSEFVRQSTDIKLCAAVQLKTKVLDEQFLDENDVVGYGQTYSAKSKEKIVILPIGYADGFTRQMKGYKMIINDSECEVVGNVCMDMTMVRVPDSVQIGDEVTIVSNEDSHTNSLYIYAEHMDSITYEALCLISRRVPRKYVYGDSEFVNNDVLK